MGGGKFFIVKHPDNVFLHNLLFNFQKYWLLSILERGGGYLVYNVNTMLKQSLSFQYVYTQVDLSLVFIFIILKEEEEENPFVSWPL